MAPPSSLFSQYRRQVMALLLLHPEQSYHLREIARLTGAAPGALARELAKLTDMGIVDRRHVGNQVHYSANRSCPVFEELASIARKTFGLGEAIAGGLAPFAERIKAAFVFGSMARSWISLGCS